MPLSYIMSIHIAAKQGETLINSSSRGSVRTKFIAENFLEDAVCFPRRFVTCLVTQEHIKVKRVSSNGNRNGMPSISIYARELIVDYGVKKIDSCGTAGSLNEDVHVRELVLAQARSDKL